MTMTDRRAMDLIGPITSVHDSLLLSNSFYHSFIASVMKSLHSRIPPSATPDLGRPAHIEIRHEYFRSQDVKRAVVFLLSNGCEWAVKSAQGCTMCGHVSKQARTAEPISANHFVSQFAAAFATISLDDIPVLNLFNNGSFFNDAEIPADARRTILRMIGANRSIKKLLVESRPEFITAAVLRETTDILQDTELEIAMGLETSDDHRRLVSINKGFTLHDFVRAADAIREHGARLRSYVLLKPPFCSEIDAIEDAVESIRTAFSLGVNTVSLEGMTVQEYTLVEYLQKRGLYSLPWLWSIVEVVKQTSTMGDVVVGLFRFYPSPEAVPTNCHLCNDRVMDAIVEYNNTRNAGALWALDCSCKTEWAEALKNRKADSEFLRDFVNVARSEGFPLRAADDPAS